MSEPDHTLYVQYDTITKSVINGNLSEAYEQMCDMGVQEMDGLLHYVAFVMENSRLALKIARCYFQQAAR